MRGRIAIDESGTADGGPQKVVRKGAFAAHFLAYLPTILISIYSVLNNLEVLNDNLNIHWAIWYAIQFAIFLFSYAGGARVTYAAWETGAARSNDLVAYFAHGRLCLRGLAVTALLTAISMGSIVLYNILLVLFLHVLTDPIRFAILMTVLIILLLIVARLSYYLYYAIELAEGEPLWRTLLFGLGSIFRNIFRIVGMAVALWWWVLAMTVVFFTFAARNLPHMLSLGVLIALMALVCWFFVPYFKLAQAGLAIEIFRGPCAAEDEPEEFAGAIRVGAGNEGTLER